jgi:hypothetical protein
MGEEASTRQEAGSVMFEVWGAMELAMPVSIMECVVHTVWWTVLHTLVSLYTWKGVSC